MVKRRSETLMSALGRKRTLRPLSQGRTVRALSTGPTKGRIAPPSAKGSTSGRGCGQRAYSLALNCLVSSSLKCRSIFVIIERGDFNRATDGICSRLTFGELRFSKRLGSSANIKIRDEE